MDTTVTFMTFPFYGYELSINELFIVIFPLIYDYHFYDINENE